MKRLVMSVLLMTILASFSVLGPELAAQAMGEDNDQMAGDPMASAMIDKRYSVSLYGGMFSPEGQLANTHFDSNPGFGGTAAIWINDYVGARGNLLYSLSEIRNLADEFAAVGDAKVWLYNADILLRWPVEFTNRELFPYLIAGVGSKLYDFDIGDTHQDVTGNFGAGVQFQLRNQAWWSLNLELRDFVSQFKNPNIDDTQHDIVMTAGVVLSFGGVSRSSY